MKVSIITVTFNSSSTIAETLASVQAQTHPQIEHIVIDGNSTDGTQAILAEHVGRVARFVSEPDDGIYDAMNKGLRLATGNYIGFLNADDVLADRDVVARIAAAAAAGEPDAIFGDLLYVDPARAQPLVRYWRTGAFKAGALRRGWMPPHPTLYVHRRVIDRIGSFDPALRISGDYDFMLRLFGRREVTTVYLPSVFVHMRTGGASNRSANALVRKSKEDLLVMRRHAVGGAFTLACKILRKLPQFFIRPEPRSRAL